MACGEEMVVSALDDARGRRMQLKKEAAAAAGLDEPEGRKGSGGHVQWRAAGRSTPR